MGVNPEYSIQIRCAFDNSPQHQPLLHGKPRVPTDVRWGEHLRREVLGSVVWDTALAPGDRRSLLGLVPLSRTLYARASLPCKVAWHIHGGGRPPGLESSSSMRPSHAAPGVSDLVLEAHVPDRYVAATMDGVVAFYWVGDADRSAMQFLGQLLDKQTAGRTRHASAVHVVHERVALPDADVRGELMAMLQDYSSITGCVGVVLLGTGFWASAMRSALTGVRMVAMGAPPMKFAQSVEEIVPWFCATHEERTGSAIHPSRITSALHHLRRLGEGPT
jgi:hypothetical protein